MNVPRSPAIIRNSLFLPDRQAAPPWLATILAQASCHRLLIALASVLLNANRNYLVSHDFMRFWLLDRIRSYKPNEELSAVKNVAMSEEYLGDHFPEFPVLPGVFMLEAATQAGSWLLRLSENFAHSIISLKEVRNVKYADFVAPGQQLEVTVSIIKKDDRLATMKVDGQIAGRPTLSGRIILERYNLVDRDPVLRATDERIINHFRGKQKLLLPGTAATAG